MKKTLPITLTALSLLTYVATADPLTLTGTPYQETFDDLTNGLPLGWSVRTNASIHSLGTEVTAVTMPTNWASSSGQFANYASTLSNYGTNFCGTESASVQRACTNRCLGIRQTGSFGDPGAAFVLEIQDTLGFANFELNLDCNMLSVQTRSNVWAIDYAIGMDPTTFTLLGTNADPCAFGSTTRTFSFGTALDNQPAPVWIRIVALDPSSGGGSRDTFGIDNIQLTYQSVAAVLPIPLQIQRAGNDTVLTWSNATFSLQAAASPGDTFTNVPGAASPYTNPPGNARMFFRLIGN